MDDKPVQLSKYKLNKSTLLENLGTLKILVIFFHFSV